MNKYYVVYNIEGKLETRVELAENAKDLRAKDNVVSVSKANKSKFDDKLSGKRLEHFVNHMSKIE